ncbi:MAG TPA: TetR/AcrR family transcriptional regulator [Microbacteriaceae bacterium]
MEDRVRQQAATGSSAHVPRRRRVTDEAMRLFGEQGYAATTVAQIEAAAGLRSGSGGLYRHFTSKRELLEHGVREQLDSGHDLLAFIARPDELRGLSLRDRLMVLAKAGLARLEDERDLNRVIVRDLRDFPELIELVRENEMVRIQSVLAAWLKQQVTPPAPDIDWNALAAVLMGGVSHYWLLRDAMGEHPSGVDQTRYLAALVDLVVARLEPDGQP